MPKLDNAVARLVSRANDLYAARMNNVRLISTFVVAIVGALVAESLSQAEAVQWLTITATALFGAALVLAVVIVALARPEVVDYEDILRQQRDERASDEETLFTFRYAEREARKKETLRISVIERLLWVQILVSILGCASSVAVLMGA